MATDWRMKTALGRVKKPRAASPKKTTSPTMRTMNP